MGRELFGRFTPELLTWKLIRSLSHVTPHVYIEPKSGRASGGMRMGTAGTLSEAESLLVRGLTCPRRCGRTSVNALI